MLLRPRDPQTLQLRAGMDTDARSVSLSEFAQVSALRWCPHHDDLLLTAVHAGARPPDVHAGHRGDFRLFRLRPDRTQWEQLGSGYAHDPVCLPQGGYVVHRGAGITVLNQDGATAREIKVGRFNWGPPSLSVNPAGDLVAWTRWVSDDRRPRIENLTTGESMQARTSLYRYGWWDDRTLIYYLGNGLRLLDAATGTTRAMKFDLPRKILDDVADGPDELRGLASLRPPDRFPEDYGDVMATPDALWFTAQLAQARGPRVQGVYRLDRHSDQLTLVLWVTGNERIAHFQVLPDGSCLAHIDIYESNRIVNRRTTATGDSKVMLEQGWIPANTSQVPEFGFHQLP